MKAEIRKTVSRYWALAILTVLLNMGVGANVDAEPYVEHWGPPVGKPLPLLEAYDHSGQLRVLENLAGKRGLLLFLNRSADW